MTAPLEGIRVADLTRLVAGDYCTSLLASLGAQVVKVEDLGRGDYIRDFGGRIGDVPVAHHLFNRGKRSIALDLKRREGVRLLRRLVASADILVEAFRPGVMDRLGFGSSAALDLNPRLVWVSISAHGGDSELAMRPGHDINYLAETGLLDRMTGADGAPALPPIPLADLIGGGLIPALTAVSMVLRARITGKGGIVDASIEDGMLLLPSVLLADIAAGAPVPADGHRTFLGGAFACYDVYRLTDGYAAVGALEEKFWAPLCEAIGHPELVPLQWQADAQEHIHTALAETFAALTKADVARLRLDETACVSVVSSYEEALTSPDTLRRGLRSRTAAGFDTLGLPFRIDGTRLRPADAAPARGGDTRSVLKELGLSEAEIEHLLADRVVSEPASDIPH